MDFNICLRQSRSIVSAALPIVDADGTLPTILPTDEEFLEALNLFSEPRLEKRMDSIEEEISADDIWGLGLPSLIPPVKPNRPKYLF